MTPQQYREAIDALGLNQSSAAEFYGVSLRTSHNWAKDGPPEYIAILVEVMLRKRIHWRLAKSWVQTKG